MRRLLILLLSASLLMMVPAIFAQGGGDAPTAPPEGTNLPITELAFEADFTDTSFWPSNNSPDEILAYEVTDKGYSITSINPDAGIGIMPIININIDDFYSEVSFTVDECISDESAFLAFSRFGDTEGGTGPNSDFYVHVVQCSGAWRSRPVTADIGPIDESGQTMRLEPGESYTLGILMVGNQNAFYLNGETIGQYEINDSPITSSGALTFGAQLGFDYTLTDWQVWAVKSTGEDILDPTASTSSDETVSNDDNPLLTEGAGEVLYQPSLLPPTSIPLGLHHAVATYIVDGGQSMAMYNNTVPEAILEFEGVDAADYYLEVIMRVRDCADTSTVGFAWRADEAFNNYYVYEVQCNGEFRVFSVINGEAGEILGSGLFEPTLTELDQFSIGVYALGEDIWLYIDDQVLLSFSDSTFTEGRVGLRLTSEDETQRMDILVGYLSVFALP